MQKYDVVVVGAAPKFVLIRGCTPWPMPLKNAVQTMAIFATIPYAATPVLPARRRITLLKARMTIPAENSVTKLEMPQRKICRISRSSGFMRIKRSVLFLRRKCVR